MPHCQACPSEAVVHWVRRPTAVELASAIASETSRRDDITLLSDPDNPPTFSDMPSAPDTVMAVYACVAHSLTLELAAHIHASGCTAPNVATLPNCDCSPEPLPSNDESESDGSSPDRVMPTGWQ